MSFAKRRCLTILKSTGRPGDPGPARDLLVAGTARRATRVPGLAPTRRAAPIVALTRTALCRRVVGIWAIGYVRLIIFFFTSHSHQSE